MQRHALTDEQWARLEPLLPRRPQGRKATRGDRLFIGLLAAAYVNLAFVAFSEKMIGWFGLDSEQSIWISFALSMGLLALILRKG